VFIQVNEDCARYVTLMELSASRSAIEIPADVTKNDVITLSDVVDGDDGR
ncbi:uncharacterized protein METZ01_LOCUS22197, partial [marine metagenome]